MGVGRIDAFFVFVHLFHDIDLQPIKYLSKTIHFQIIVKPGSTTFTVHFLLLLKFELQAQSVYFRWRFIIWELMLFYFMFITVLQRRWMLENLSKNLVRRRFTMEERGNFP